MNKIFFRLILFVIFLCFPFSVFSAESKYQFDPTHSYVLWHISHFGFSNPTGKWWVNGTLTYDPAKPQTSKVNVTIHVADIDTGLPELNDHLKNVLFFDVEKFPMATFASDKITMTGKDTGKMTGILTVHGVSKSVVLNVKLNKMGVNPITEKETIGATASTLLKRSDFGMTTLLPGLGDDVKIDIEIEAYKIK